MKQATLNNDKPLAGIDPGVTNLFTLHSIVEKKSIKNKQYVKHFKKKKKKRKKRKKKNRKQRQDTREKLEASSGNTSQMPLVEDVQVPFNPATQEKISSSYSTKRYYHETMVSTSNRIRKLWHQMANGENIVEETAKFTFNQ